LDWADVGAGAATAPKAIDDNPSAATTRSRRARADRCDVPSVVTGRKATGILQFDDGTVDGPIVRRVIVAGVGGSARASHPGPWHSGWWQARFVAAAFFVAGSSALAAGCGNDDPDPPQSVSTDAVLTALVDWAVESDAAPTTTDDEPPVVYITASNGETIDAAVQASVVEATTDEATVRFADDRSEAIDDTTDDQRCHDDGVLLVVGELPEEAEPSDVPVSDVPVSDVMVERYRAADDAGVFVVTLAPSGDGASVTGEKAG
jgi:hypothetical protein